MCQCSKDHTHTKGKRQYQRNAAKRQCFCTLKLILFIQEKRFSQKPCGKSHLWCPGQNPVGIRPGKQVLKKDIGITTLIDAFEQWYWSRLLRVPWPARRPNQSILKEITLNVHWKDCCWSWSSNTLATWCKKLTLWKRPWC